MLQSPYHIPKVTPPAEHPRLMLRRKDIPRIKENMSHPDNARAMVHYNRLLNTSLSEFYDEIHFGGYSLLLYLVLEAKAFDCLINDKKQEARELIETMKFIMKNATGEGYSLGHRALEDVMNSRAYGHMVFVASLVYDWFYDCFDAEERLEYIALCENVEKRYNEHDYPPRQAGLTSGHNLEDDMLKNMLSFAIAAYDERPDIYNYVAGMMFDVIFPAMEVQFQSRYQHQGGGYGSYRYCAAMWAQLLIYSMSGVKALSEDVERVADGFLYLVRPDGEALRCGDDCTEGKAGFTMRHPFAVPMFMAYALTGDSNYKKYYDKNNVDEFMLPSWYKYDFYEHGSFGEGSYSPVMHLIWNRLTPDTKGEDYPKAKYFPYPTGITIFKDEQTETMVYMKIGMVWGNLHEHFDAGSFQIYHKGILASDSGAYGIFGTDHHFHYTITTGAHNCITVVEPSKVSDELQPFHPLGGIKYNGGQFIPDRSACRDMERWQKEMRVAEVLSHTETDELVEIEGDLSLAYREACEKVTRKMSYYPKQMRFRVEDYVRTKAEENEVRFHLHMQNEPIVEGNTITIYHKGGALKATVVEPANVKIDVIGGPGKEFVTLGVNYPYTDKWVCKESGWGQVMLTSQEGGKEHRFVVEMEIFDREILGI